MASFVISTVRVHGFHHWQGAPPAVQHLSLRHRHEFVIRARAEVGHNNRDIEFQLLGAKVLETVNFLWGGRGLLGYEFGGASCEMIGARLLEALPELSSVSVWEDDENGAEVVR